MPSLFFVKDGEKTMANADISLLFGVLGEGSLGGESGSLIQSQLTQIMTALNKNPLKVKVALDTDAGGQNSGSHAHTDGTMPNTLSPQPIHLLLT